MNEYLLCARHLARSRVEPQQNSISAFTEFMVQWKIRKPSNNLIPVEEQCIISAVWKRNRA